MNHQALIVNDEDEESNTPLHLAAAAGHEVVVRELLQAGANITARCGALLIYLCLLCCHPEVEGRA